MTDNVVSFPGTTSILSKSVVTMIEWFKNQDVPIILAEMFSNISNDKVRSVLSDRTLDDTTYGRTPPQDDGNGRLFMQTDFRKRLVPEFGTQAHTTFFEAYWFNTKDFNIPSPFPDDLMQQLCKYFDSYPEVNMANRTAFCYALLESVLLDNRFRYVKLDLDPNEPSFASKFTIGLTEENDTSKLYILVIDFLPILLDNNAVSYWKEKMEPEFKV